MVQARIVDTACGPVEAAVIGAGPVLVIVHGTGGTWRQALPLARALADDATVVLPSRSGYGETPLRTGRTHAEQAASYAALLDALELDRAVILGISGGGPSTLAFAESQAHRCRGLVLASAVAAPLVELGPLRFLAALPGSVRLYALLEQRRRVAALADPKRQTAYIGRLLTDTERRRAAADAELDKELGEFLRDTVAGGDGAAGLRNDLQQLRPSARSTSGDRTDVRVPTLVLHGDPDDIVPVAHARHHARAIPNAQLEVFPGAGHLLLLTCLREGSERVRRFLAGIPS